MKYFLDTQYHEYCYKPIWGKAVNTIEPISIGIVSEDITQSYTLYYDGDLDFNLGIGDTWDRYTDTNLEALQALAKEKSSIRKGWKIKKDNKAYEYFAICKEFDLEEAWRNVKLRNKVLIPMTEELSRKELASKRELSVDSLSIESYRFTVWLGAPAFKDFKRLVLKYGKTREQMANDIKAYYTESVMDEAVTTPIEFYGYHSAYDWVVLCQLYGEAYNLPEIFPLYCADLKQTLRERWTPYSYGMKGIEEHPDTNKTSLGHNAMQNAMWIKSLYKFLEKI